MRSFLCAIAIAVAGAGCGGGAKAVPDAAPDAMADAMPAIDARPVLVAHRYVVSRILLPTRFGDGDKYGIDLDGDGNVDDAFGNVLAALASAAGQGSVAFQTDTDEAVNRGTVILLADLDATSILNSTPASLRLFDGADPQPSPCTDPNDYSTCGQHLQGTGAFTIAASSPTDATIDGKIVGGVYSGGPGTAILPLTIFGGTTELRLIGARANLAGLTADGITNGKLGGGISQTEVDDVLLPGIEHNVTAQITRDCTGVGADCGCRTASAGAVDISLFDKAPADCAVTVDEIRNNDLIKTLLAPDVTIDGMACLSIGVGVSVAAATYPVP